MPVRSQARALSWRKQVCAGQGGQGAQTERVSRGAGAPPPSGVQSVGCRELLQRRGRSHSSLSGYGAGRCSVGLGGQTEVRTGPVRGDRSRPPRLRSPRTRVCRTLGLSPRGSGDTGGMPLAGPGARGPPGARLCRVTPHGILARPSVRRPRAPLTPEASPACSLCGMSLGWEGLAPGQEMRD